MTFRFAFNMLHFFGKKYIIRKWGRGFYKAYRVYANAKLKDLEKEAPKSVHKTYDFFYKSIVAFVPIYYSLQKMGITVAETEMIIWRMNESTLSTMPRSLFGLRKPNRKSIEQAKEYQKLGERGALGKDEWIMTTRVENDGSIHTNFTQCGAYEILSRLGYGFVFPCACRIDYLTANLSGIKFVRNKTIGDGDDICENHYFGSGFTEWAPEKGFISRK